MSTDADAAGRAPSPDEATVERLFDKLRAFVDGLDDDERGAFAALLAPGVAQAYLPEDEVAGFMIDDWAPIRLPDAIADAIRARRWRVDVGD